MRIEQVLIPMVRQIVSRPKLADALLGRTRWGNPFSDEASDDPMTLAPAMRDDGPVYWNPLYQQWFIMGYEEAREVLASPHVGTQNQMDVLLDVTPYTKLSAPTRTFLSNLLLLTDPPKHTRLRALVSRAFTPRQVARLEPRMIELSENLLDEFGDTVELMDAFGTRFPAMVITELVGFDPSEWKWLQGISTSLTKITDPMRSFDPAELDTAFEELRSRTLALAAERTANPTEDLLTGLALAEEEGDRLSEDELVAMVGLILIAGYETTSAMIGLSTLHLHEHPDQLALLREDPELWPNAVEELLRFEPALRTDPRTALEDFELGGKTIKKGQNIAVMVQLANRDHQRHENADELHVDRADPAQLTFGHGIHFCVGASLARAELRTALPRLMDKLDDYTVDRSNIDWRESITIRGIESFTLTRKP